MSRDPRFSGPQLDAFGNAASKAPKMPAHQAHSETSRAAAIHIQPKASGLRYEVLSVISDAGEAGATRKEIEVATGMLTQTVTPRLVELEQSGNIRKLTFFSEAERKIATVKREGCAVYVLNRSAA